MKGVKIVIIEDDSGLAEALQENLSAKGFVVRTAGTGEDGLELIKESHPDLILLDSLLPGMSGIEVLEALKPIREKNNIPVIMLSNLDNPDDLKAARAYDIEEYLIKTDWRLDDVISKIKSAIK